MDLGIVAGAQAVEEIVDPKARLERELGAAAPYFCYPFGRESQLSEQNRQVVREAGYACCLSAHGGTVRSGDDPFRLKRTSAGDTWFARPYHFGLEVGLRKW